VAGEGAKKKKKENARRQKNAKKENQPSMHAKNLRRKKTTGMKTAPQGKSSN